MVATRGRVPVGGRAVRRGGDAGLLVLLLGSERGWVGKAPGGGQWTAHVFLYFTAALWAFAAAETRRVCRTRWAVAALGAKRLAGGALEPGLSEVAAALAPPRLKPLGAKTASKRHLAVAVFGGVGLPVLLLSAPAGMTPVPPKQGLLLLAQAAAIGWWFLLFGVARWWGVPTARQRWLTDEGAVTRTLAVRWADAARVAVADVPPGAAAWLPAGSVALEVCDGDRAERFFAGPEVRPELDRLLAAVPADRLVRAGEA